MRTNIEIDEQTMAKVMKLLGTSTKRETVDRLMRERLQIEGQSVMKKWRGKIDWQGDLDSWRRD